MEELKDVLRLVGKVNDVEEEEFLRLAGKVNDVEVNVMVGLT